MAISNAQANIEALSMAVKATFAKGLKMTDVFYPRLTTEIKVSDKTVEYPFLGGLPKMTEWTSSRTASNIASYKYTIVAKKWANGIKVDVSNLTFDKAGIIKPQIMQMAQDAKRHYDDLIFGLINTNGTCYDTKAMFATDHPVGSATMSNKGTLTLTSDNLLASIEQMMSIKGTTGAPLGIVPDLLVVPINKYSDAKKVVENMLVGGGDTNPTHKIVDIMASPYITGTKTWYLFDTKKPMKPFILQKVQDIRFTAMDKPNDELRYEENQVRYGCDSIDNAGYGFWQTAYMNEHS